MTEFSFYLSEEDTRRLFAIKELQGRGDLTGNDFARELLEGELYRLFPAAPQYDERGELTNADVYRKNQTAIRVTPTLREALEKDQETKQAVIEALRRFADEDWGSISFEYAEKNDFNTENGHGVVLAKYETPTGDIYILGFPGTDELTRVSYCQDAGRGIYETDSYEFTIQDYRKGPRD